MAAHNEMSEEELSALKDVMPPTFSGVEQSEEMLRWIWENFSAVAGDQPSFECWRKFPIFLVFPNSHPHYSLLPQTDPALPFLRTHHLSKRNTSSNAAVLLPPRSSPRGLGNAHR